MRKLSCFSSNLNILWTTAKLYQAEEDARNAIESLLLINIEEVPNRLSPSKGQSFAVPL